MIAVCRVEDVPLGEGRAVTVGERRLAVFHTRDGWYALDDACPHLGGPLADGLVTETTVACPLHERRFELATGRPVGHDCGHGSAFGVEVRGDDVFLTREKGATPACRS